MPPPWNDGCFNACMGGIKSITFMTGVLFPPPRCARWMQRRTHLWPSCTDSWSGCTTRAGRDSGFGRLD